jgi:DNA-binding GntR family transcriptional regulator
MTSTFAGRPTVVIVVNPLSPVPLYVQLANLLEAEIKAGKLAPGALLPSEKQLVQEHGVARGTARRAVELLRERGLVMTIQARGTYVAEKPSS